MTKAKTPKELILDAAATGRISLTDLDDGDDFEAVAEYLDYTSDEGAREIAIAAGLIEDTAGDIHEIMYESARRRARDAGIKGA